MLEDWRSENVRFDGVDSSNVQRPGFLKASFLNFKIPGPYEAAQAVSSNDPLSSVRDHIFFGLGIILLRLYFEPPLKEFHGARDKEKGTKFADLLAARRPKTTIGSTLGSRYGSIAKKCLNCEFDVVEHDLRDSTLQAAFFGDVVQELQAPESMFRGYDTDCKLDAILSKYSVDVCL